MEEDKKIIESKRGENGLFTKTDLIDFNIKQQFIILMDFGMSIEDIKALNNENGRVLKILEFQEKDIIEAPKEKPKEPIKEVPKDKPKEAIKEVPKDKSKEAIKEVPKDKSKEAPKDKPKEAPKDKPLPPPIDPKLICDRCGSTMKMLDNHQQHGFKDYACDNCGRKESK